MTFINPLIYFESVFLNNIIILSDIFFIDLSKFFLPFSVNSTFALSKLDISFLSSRFLNIILIFCLLIISFLDKSIFFLNPFLISINIKNSFRVRLFFYVSVLIS